MKAGKSFLARYMRLFAMGLAVLLVIEIGGLIYVDRSYLAENPNDIRVQQITKGVTAKTSSIKVKFDGEAKKIKASYDGQFLAYTINGELEVLNLNNGSKSRVGMSNGLTLGFYKWVYDRDQLIIAEMSPRTSRYYAKLYNLNVREESSKPEEIRNTLSNTEARITMPGRSYNISDIDFSTSTVTTYLKLTSKYGRSVLWKFNVPLENKAYSYISTKKIGHIQCLKNESELLYENSYNGKVCMAGEGSIKVGTESKFRLLGFDKDDNIFLSSGDGDTTKEILYGSLLSESGDDNFTINLHPDMKSIKMPQQVSVNDIYITLDGGIYVCESDKNVFKNLLTGKEISYRGEVKSVYGKGFITVNDGYILQNSFE